MPSEKKKRKTEHRKKYYPCYRASIKFCCKCRISCYFNLNSILGARYIKISNFCQWVSLSLAFTKSQAVPLFDISDCNQISVVNPFKSKRRLCVMIAFQKITVLCSSHDHRVNVPPASYQLNGVPHRFMM